MSTNIAQVTHRSLPALTHPVQMSGSLAYHVRGEYPHSPDNDAYGLVAAANRAGMADVAEAQRKLPEAEHLCRPASPEVIAIWCGRLLAVLPWGPQDEKSSQAAVTAVVMACSELPAAVWTSETTTLALRTFKRWPAPAEIYALLEPIGRPFIRIRDGLRRVVTSAQPLHVEPSDRDRSPDACEHVASIVRAFVADRSFNQPINAPQRPQATPRHLSEGHLLAEYQKALRDDPEGLQAHAYRTRIKMLQARIAKANRAEEDARAAEGRERYADYVATGSA